MNQEGNYFLKDIDENYKHQSSLVSVQLRLSYQSFFLASTCEQLSSFLRSYARAKFTNYVNQPALTLPNSRLEASPLIARTLIFLQPFFAQKMVIKEERDCLQFTSTEDMNKGSLHSNVLLCSSDLK